MLEFVVVGIVAWHFAGATGALAAIGIVLLAETILGVILGVLRVSRES